MDDDNIPTIDLNPSSSNTVNSADGDDLLSNEGGEPLLSGYDQPSGDPASADSNISQDEEAAASDDENASTTSYQGEYNPFSRSGNNANPPERATTAEIA
jgi:hypothetical protein